MAQTLHFLLRENLERAVLLHLLKCLETMNATLNRLEVRQHAAEPTFVDVVHIRTECLLADGLLCLLLRADEEHGLPFLCNAAKEIVRLIHLAHRLLQINDVDTIALREDVTCHLRVPATRLMSEMDTCLQKLLHRNDCHKIPPVVLPRFSSAVPPRKYGTEQLSKTRVFYTRAYYSIPWAPKQRPTEFFYKKRAPARRRWSSRRAPLSIIQLVFVATSGSVTSTPFGA